MKRREFFRQAGIGSATLASLPALAHALTRPAWTPSPLDADGQPANTFSILLSGPYKPVVNGPALGLVGINLNDGSYTTTKIYPVSGLPEDDGGHDDRGHRRGDRDREIETSIGNFFVGGKNAVYDLPGGAMAMVFTGNHLMPAPDGQGGTYLVGTIQLNITDATGIFHSFVGGHNNMVDILHHLADGSFFEHCFCVISRP
jgi:hypothetical protein